MKRLNGKLIASVIVFTCMGLLLGDTNENNTYNQQNSVLFPEDEIDIEIDQGNQNVVDVSVQPPEAALTNRGEFNVHPIDNEQFVSAYETNWNKTGSGQISISQPGNYILLTTSITGGTGEFNYNFVLSPGIRQARLQVNWSVNSVVGDDIIRWQYYPGSGSDWLNCTETGADGSDDLSEGLYNLTIQANSGYEQNIRVRLRMENYARTVGQTAQIRINSIDIMAFNTEISDTSVGSAYTDLSNQVSITVNIETSGLSSISGITQNPTHYVIYYQTNSSAVNDTVGIPVQKTSGSFTGDFASLTYLFDMPGLYNTTLYYALRVNDTSNYKYWSSTYEINCYDGFTPNNGSVTTIPANLNDLHYDDSLTIVVPVIDSGGMNLSRVNYYWRVGNPVVSNIPGQFDGSNVCYVSGTSDTANLIIPTEALVAYTDT